MLRTFAVLAAVLFTSLPAFAQEPRTAAEATKFAKTSTNAEVIAFCETLAKQHPATVAYRSYGKSHEGAALPMLVLNKSKEEKPPTFLVFANIHAGEVDGKEAVLALARELAVNDKLLDKVRIVLLPNINPDGNDRFSEKHRTEQKGPPSVGTRENAQGFDLNRDFVKLESPEIRALTKTLREFDPLLIIDCHTTNGSRHEFTLTYDGPRIPAGSPELAAFAFQKLLPTVGESVTKATSFKTYHYGTFSKDRKTWESYPALPCFGVQMFALRGTLGILSESYSYATFEDRIKATHAFVKANLDYAAEHLGELQKATKAAREPVKRVAIRTKTTPQDQDEILKEPGEKPGDETKTHTIRRMSKVVPTLEVELPAAYLIPAENADVADTLQRHGIVVAELREEIELDVQEEVITEIGGTGVKYQNRFLISTLETKPRPAKIQGKPGMFLVRTNQPLGALAAYLLEPRSEDGLTTWNCFPKLEAGQVHPVRSVLPNQPIFTGKPRAVPEERVTNQLFTPEHLKLGRGGLAGEPMGDITWLPDGEHWLQVKEGKLWKIVARTGRAVEQFVDVKNIEKSLKGLPGIQPAELGRQLARPAYTFDPKFERILVTSRTGHYIAHRNGKPGVLLANGEFGIATFSPDGKWIAFIREGNLFVVDTSTGKQKQLTADGGKNGILNGRADWVYEEEIFHRRGQAYWWAPDSEQIAILRFDDTPVPKFAITHNAQLHSTVENISYPKPGDKNPTVKIGVLKVTDEKPETKFLSLEGYKPEDTIISRVGWVPGDKPVPFAYVQNRIQTWLDMVKWPDLGEKPVKLFREETGAWVEDLGEPKWRLNGTFLLLRDAVGHKHIHHIDKDGKTLVQATKGNYDVREILNHDPSNFAVIYLSNRFAPAGASMELTTYSRYRAKREVTPRAGPGRIDSVKFSPDDRFYMLNENKVDDPGATILAELKAFDPGSTRVLNSNPIYEREKYRFGKYERIQIKTRDGYEMEAAITYPPDFDPAKKYPIWMLTYGGPDAPTIKDGWGGGRVFEQVLAAQGIVVVRVDPQSASGKGMVNSKVCYKQLGVKELQDLEDAVDWLAKKPWADTKRVGISGHSYGGFLTAFALTHSKKFSAGIAGAPVTDWRLYDSIYTERYMGLPSENKEGYDKTSVIKAAKDLHGELLIVHGLVDDNVHAQNSLQLIAALQKAGKDFEVMVYPNDRHGIAGTHYTQTQLKFILRTMGVKK